MAPAYALERAKAGFLRLRAAALILCCLCAAITAYRVWSTGFSPSHAAILTGCLLVAGVLLWAEQRRYVVFCEQSAFAASEAPELRAEEKLFLHGSGIFEVNNMARYLVEVPVVFWTTQLGDHILAARVRALNLMGVGVPSEERGWWYMFIEPKHVREITAGHLCFGLWLRPALRVRYETEQGRQLLHLSCDSTGQQTRLLRELQTKAEAAGQRIA